jgi:hypothetical protein
VDVVSFRRDFRRFPGSLTNKMRGRRAGYQRKLRGASMMNPATRGIYKGRMHNNPKLKLET